MTVSPEIVLVPLDPVGTEFLELVKRSVFRNFRRSIGVLDGYLFEEIEGGGRSVEPHISNILPKIFESANKKPETVVFFVNRSFNDGSLARIVRGPDGPRIFLIPLDSFPDTTSKVRGIIHSLGHGYGLRACPVPGCVMNHLSFTVLDKNPDEEPSLCLECSQSEL